MKQTKQILWILTMIYFKMVGISLTGQTLLFEEDWISESPPTGNGVDGSGNNIRWYTSNNDVFISGRELKFTNADRGAFFDVTIPGGSCQEAIIQFTISHTDDIEGECNIGSTCECSPIPYKAGTGNTIRNNDYVDVYIDGFQVPPRFNCGQQMCNPPCGASQNSSCNLNASYHTLYGDCDGNTIGNDFGSESFYETIFNNGSDINLYIEAKTTANAESITVSDIVVDCTVLRGGIEGFSLNHGEKGTAILKWEFTAEVEDYSFQIEKKIGQNSFSKIGTMSGYSTIFRHNTYQFIDPAPQLGHNYYRIKQIDSNGQQRVSTIKSIYIDEISKNVDLLIFPNPADKVISIPLHHNHISYFSLEILDISGFLVRKLSRLKSSTAFYKLAIEDLEPGIYLLRIYQKDSIKTGFFVKI